MFYSRGGVAKVSNRDPIDVISNGFHLSEDKLEHSTLALKLAAFTGFPVAVPNYRLTPKVPTKDEFLHHPAHAEDILRFLTFVATEWKGPDALGQMYDPGRLFLMGHSCSAHMLASIFLDSSLTSPSLTPSPPVLAAVKAISLSEGIYDLDLLLTSFPTYRELFVEAAFDSRESYAEFSTTSFPFRQSGAHIKWLIVHSKGDVLVDRLQADTFFNHLRGLYKSIGEAPALSLFSCMDVLEGDHNDILRGDDFVQIVGNFMLDRVAEADNLSRSRGGSTLLPLMDV